MGTLSVGVFVVAYAISCYSNGNQYDLHNILHVAEARMPKSKT